MSPTFIPKRHVLDPRPAAQASVRALDDAVSIPLVELPDRTAELPARDVSVAVADVGEDGAAAVAWLRGRGRRAHLVVPHELTGAPPARGRLWEPSPIVSTVAAALPPGRALDLGCGTGRDAVYLAAAGWEVQAVDVLPDAIDRGRGLVGRYEGLGQRIQWQVADVAAEGYTPGARFDLISMVRFMDGGLLTRLADWLRPGGSLAFDVFTPTHRARHGRPGPELVASPAELASRWRAATVLHAEEAWRGEAHTARVWLRPGAG